MIGFASDVVPRSSPPSLTRVTPHGSKCRVELANPFAPVVDSNGGPLDELEQG